MNEKIDDPSSTASARVQRTCSVIAVAPDTANAPSAARRDRSSIAGGGGRTGPSRLAAAAAASRRSSIEMPSPPASAGRMRRATRMAPASTRSNDAAVTFVQRRPIVGRKMNPAQNAPATAPNRFTE